MMTLKRMRCALGTLLIAAVLVGQPGCSFIVGKAAMEGGKFVYKKVKEDKAEKNAAKSESAGSGAPQNESTKSENAQP